MATKKNNTGYTIRVKNPKGTYSKMEPKDLKESFKEIPKTIKKVDTINSNGKTFFELLGEMAGKYSKIKFRNYLFEDIGTQLRDLTFDEKVLFLENLEDLIESVKFDALHLRGKDYSKLDINTMFEDFLKFKRKSLENTKPFHNTQKNEPIVNNKGNKGNSQPEYDINNWNKICFDLFNYLAENYNSTAIKQKFINIWFYLEYHTKDNYMFNFKKDLYKIYISDRFKFDFSKTKLNKPNNFDNQLQILDNLYTNYCNKLKEGQ